MRFFFFLIPALALSLLSAPASANDPNCQINTTVGGAIRGLYASPTATNEQQARDLVAMLTFANLSGGAGTLYNNGAGRLDRQGSTPTHMNLQVQFGNATRAAILVNHDLLGTNVPSRQEFVQRKARDAFYQSMTTKKVVQIDGPCQ